MGMVFVVAWVGKRSKTFYHRGTEYTEKNRFCFYVIASGLVEHSAAVVVHGRSVNDEIIVGWALPTIIHVGQCPTYEPTNQNDLCVLCASVVEKV